MIGASGIRRVQEEAIAYPTQSRISRFAHRVTHWWSSNGAPKTYSVAVVTPTLQGGGAERWAASMAKCLNGDGVSCCGLVVLNTAHVADSSLSRRIRGECPLLTPQSDLTDVLQSDAIIMWGVGKLPKQFNGYRGRIIYACHSASPDHAKVLRDAIEHCTDIAAVSSKAASIVPSEVDCTIIHNGVDLARCEALIPWEYTRAIWGAGEDDILVAYIGGCHAQKHLEVIAEACALLEERYRPVYIGAMTLCNECRLDEINPRSIFTGYVSHIGDALAAVDVVCLLSDTEAMSLALCEAWAAKVPTICTNVGAITELQERFGEITRIVKSPATARDVAKAITLAMSLENDAVISRAKKMAREYCSEEAMGRRWRAFIRTVMHKAVTHD